MNSTEQIPSMVNDLLAPVGRMLDRGADDAQRISQACDQLREAVSTLEDGAGDEWSLCGRTMANLLEIVSCFADGPDPLDAETTAEIVAFVKGAIPRLQEADSDGAGESEAELIELTQQARSRWGEYLTLVDGNGFYASASLESEVVTDFAPSDEEMTDVCPADQVDLILSAVKELTQAASDASASDDSNAMAGLAAVRTKAAMPATKRSPRQPGTLPRVPAAPQKIALSETLLEAYLEDAEQCLSSMERCVIAHENDTQGKAPIDQLGRNLHTLKGASASIGLSELATYMHEIEEWLPSCELDENTVGLQPILDCVDFVRSQIDSLQQRATTRQDAASFEPSPAAVPQPPSLPSVSAGVERASEAGEETIRVRSSQLDRMMNLLVDLVIWRRRRDRRVAELSESGDELSRCVRRLEALAKGQSLHRTAAGGPATAAFDEPAPAENESRESSNRLSELTNDLREIAGSIRECRQSMADENRAVSQFIQQFRQQLAQARRVPLSGLFQRLQRVVREAGRLENKQVRLECIGQYTGLERSLQERLYEPLLHLVRNAVCHGIEPVDKRVRAGKDAAGTITLEASGSTQMLLLEVRDDGGGLDFDAIRRRGIERGLLRPDEPVSPNELSRLIFHPGFSTRTEANEVAGRGVGMDVVLTALNRCHCQIDVHSESGIGTTFRLAIPLPSVIEHALVFRCGNQLFGLPMQFVMSSSLGDPLPESLEPSDSARLELNQILKLPRAGAHLAMRSLVLGSNLQPRPATHGKAASASTLRAEHRREFAVDEILGPEEVVVRPLPPLLRRHPVLSGVTLSGAGEVVLLLDGPRLLKLAAETAVIEPSSTQRSSTPLVGRASDSVRPKVLIAEDSLSARRRLVEKLAPYEFDVTEASDGAEALNLARATTFDAVFSDLEMPGLNGFELLTAIKNDPRTPNKPVVIVTSRDEPETRAKARELGADGFLSKPVSDASIEAMLEQLVIKPTT